MRIAFHRGAPAPLVGLWLLATSPPSTGAQERYLVSPNQEIVPLGAGAVAGRVIDAASRKPRPASGGACNDRFYFGNSPDLYPPSSSLLTRHRDVIGQWFVAPASGIIDTIYFRAGQAIGAYDSTVFVAVHRSQIGPSYGPGIRPGPFDPPCEKWGYYVNTNDIDQGVAAFLENATDTGWVSTVNGLVPSTPPFDEQLWGYTGVPVNLRANETASLGMGILGDSLEVSAGEVFFVSLTTAHGFTAEQLFELHEHPEWETPTYWPLSEFVVTTADEDYPSRIWKFYEHDKGPSSCDGAPPDSLPRGWYARSSTGWDSLTVSAFNIWYSMHVRTNTPPIIQGPPDLYPPVPDRFDTGSHSIAFTIEDCDPSDPGKSGVATLLLKLSVNRAPQGSGAGTTGMR